MLIPSKRGEWCALVDLLRSMPRPTRAVKGLMLVLALDSEWIEEEKTFLSRAINDSRAGKAIARVEFLSCVIPGAEFVDSSRERTNLVALDHNHGPEARRNALFFQSIRQVMDRGLAAGTVLLIEPGVVATGDDWLDGINGELARLGDFLLAGSVYQGESVLPESIRGHISGNAVFNLAHPGFPEFLAAWEALVAECTSETPDVAYDVVIEWARANQALFVGKPLYRQVEAMVRLCRDRIRPIQSIVNLAGPHEIAPDYVFSVYRTRTSFPDARLVRCPAAIPHGKHLRSAFHSGDPARASDAVLAYDHRWQYPANTEMHAFLRAREALPQQAGTIYFAFPWATLIDLAVHNQSQVAPLLEELRSFRPRLEPFQRVVTVCQHVYLARHAHFLEEVGVTDVFWSHAVKGEGYLLPGVRVHPFPLFPVQHMPWVVPESGGRRYLFSFVGARAYARDLYLTDTRNLIIQKFARHPRGYVAGRDVWHYQDIVYEKQILQRQTGRPWTDEDKAREFREVLAQSVFSLCPSGSGTNSIRLWESIGSGAIPVILSDTWLPPGDPEIWQEAAVFCQETPEAIAALPESLAAMAADASLLARKRRALQILWQRYGIEDFIFDIRKFFGAVCQEEAGPGQEIDERLLRMAIPVLSGQAFDHHALSAFGLAWATRMRIRPAALDAQLEQSLLLRRAVRYVLDNAKIDVRKAMLAACLRSGHRGSVS